jgi:Flp pilus assembly protein TadG
MRFRDEEGQAVIIVALAMSIFLIGAIGLGIDGAHLYAQRQMAQSAADATALAAITSIFQGTAGAPTTGFSTSSAFTCTTTDTRTPCVLASKNGFGGTSSDTVTIDFPSSVPGVPSSLLSPDYPVNIVRATVKRDVSTTLMRLLGPTLTNVSTTATAAIAYVISPVPILVTHPTLPSALSMNGTPNVKICGGPRRSIQVNSNDPAGNAAVGNSTIDLSHAGPLDPGNCTTGTGSDYGTRGGPNTPPFTFLSGVGRYITPDLIMQDPLANVSPPPVPTNATGTFMGTSQPLANGTSGCPASPVKACQLYYPGLYTSGINGDNSTPVFLPGIYYIQSTQGFTCRNNCNIYMATGAAADTYTLTGWTNNVLFYNTGPTSNPTNAGRFDLSANGSVDLIGSPISSSYKGILFFQDRNSDAHINTNSQAHRLGGGGSMTLQGTIYLTNTLSTMFANSTHYQALILQGGPGSGTLIQGEIIVGTLSLGGNGNITMNLDPNGYLYVSQIALVN